MSPYGQVFRTVLQTYDLALIRSGKGVEQGQRTHDILEIVTEFHRRQEEQLAIRREKRRRNLEAKERRAAEIAARLQETTPQDTKPDSD